MAYTLKMAEMARGEFCILDNVAYEVIKNGHCKFMVEDDVYDLVMRFAAAVDNADLDYRRLHNNEQASDGFMGVGSEYSNINNKADLCRRFCYWNCRHEFNKERGVTDADVYMLARGLESRMSIIAQAMMSRILYNFDLRNDFSGREYSYLQACLYEKSNAVQNRMYAQEPHEDGHFLTFITADSGGLSLHNGKTEEEVSFARNEFIAIAGSALSILSDHAIRSIYHSVKSGFEEKRISVVYFINPDLRENYTSFYQSNLINFMEHIQKNHISFGNSVIRK